MQALHDLLKAYPLVMAMLPVPVIALMFSGCFLVSRASGWWRLRLQFASPRPMPPGSFTGSGTFRSGLGYNHVLRMGADHENLYLRCWLSLAHPSLAIPWSEIEIGAPRTGFAQTLILGRDLRIPLTLAEPDAARLIRSREE